VVVTVFDVAVALTGTRSSAVVVLAVSVMVPAVSGIVAVAGTCAIVVVVGLLLLLSLAWNCHSDC